MENASKALIMAAEVMIGVLVLSLMVYLFVSFGSNSAEINEQVDETKLAEFNNQFDKYRDQTDNTIYDIVTLANLARENNEYYELDTPTNSNYYISIKIGSKNIEKMKSNELKKYITDEVESITVTQSDIDEGNVKILNTYSCKVTYNDITGRVKTVEFTKI